MEMLIAVVGIMGTLAATIITQMLTTSREKRRLQFENEKLELEIKKFEIEHPRTTRVEFNIKCRFYGPIDGDYITEFILVVGNKGFTGIKLYSLVLRARGIKRGDHFESFDGVSRLSFPYKIFDTNVIPLTYKYYIIEPGVEQTITFVTRVPEEFDYILTHAKFEYDKYAPHTTERMFEVGCSSE